MTNHTKLNTVPEVDAHGSRTIFSLASARARATDVRLVQPRPGHTIASRVVGGGMPVVLIHGITDNRGAFHDVQSALEGEAETHAVDLPGHGLADIPDRPLTLREQAESVIGYLDAAGLNRCVVVGNSMGGGVALGVARFAPHRVSGVVLLGSLGADFPTPFGLGLLRVPFIASQMPRIATNPKLRRAMLRDSFAPGFVPDESVQHRYWNAWRVEGRPKYASVLLRAVDVAEPWDWLPEIRVRVHVVHGARDAIIPVSVAHRIAARLPNAHTTVLRDVGHMPQIETPSRVVEFIRGAMAGG